MVTCKVLVLIEEHYDETEFNVFNSFFPAHGVEVNYASYLWGNDALEFEGNDKSSKVQVDLCVTNVNLEDYKGLILIGGYAMDRLRYQPHLNGSHNTAPAVELLRQAVKRMDAGQLAVGTICHSLWLFCADPDLLRGRHVTCAHNIVCDVENAGGNLVVANAETVDIHADGLLITGRHPGSVDAFDDLFLKTILAI
ncbi:DJ-1/PfpI family protein [Vulcanococcus limneticus]|uniref:DJ-1/PfpI family protein n=1 Tax=Vulcanococcus limneticus TaxID=2170428 RepID=UPI00398BD773